jgi:hypothetical protein
MFSYVIQLETTIHYISIFMSLQFYSWLTIRHECFISLYSYPLQIEKSSDPYLYSSNIRFEFIFDNIQHTYPHPYSFWKYGNGYDKGTVRSASDPFPPLDTMHATLNLDGWGIQPRTAVWSISGCSSPLLSHCMLLFISKFGHFNKNIKLHFN